MKNINTEVVKGTIRMLGVDEYGLEKIDRDLLLSLLNNFAGGPIGLSTLAASISEDEVCSPEGVCGFSSVGSWGSSER